MENFETLSDMFKALSDPTRLRLLKLLKGQTVTLCSGGCDEHTYLCVGALANELNVTQSAVSQHLRVLKQVGLVKGERRGSFMHYTVNPDGIEKYRELAGNIFPEKSGP